MKYWLLTTEFPPHHGGGISTYCDETAALMSGLGFAVTVFVADWKMAAQSEVSSRESIRVIRFNPEALAAGTHLTGTALLAYGFKEAVRQEAAAHGLADIIEAQDYLGIAYFLLQEKRSLADWIASVPICISLHSPEFAVRAFNEDVSYRFPKFWTDELERFCIRAADAIWTPSLRVMEALGPEFHDLKARLIRNPFRPLLRDADAEYSRAGLYYFGRLQPLKGISEALEAYSRLVADGFQEPLNLVGGDARHPMTGHSVIETVSKKHKHLFDQGFIRIHGLVSHENAFKLLANARLVMMPSRYENFPYAVIEAMSLGRVVLCSRQSGASEIIEHGENGFLFDHANPNELEARLRDAWSMSDAELDGIGRRAAASVETTCDPSVIARQKQEGIEEALRTHVPPRTQKQFPFIRVGRSAPADHEALPEMAHLDGMLSVVVPYFNMGRYIDEALESLLACDYHTLEILVCNAESTDAASIAKFYTLQTRFEGDPRFKFFNVPDRGLAHSRNDGVLRARGEYVTFLDPDDKVRPTYYSRAVQILETYRNVGFVGRWVQYFEGSTGRFIGWNPEPPYVLFHNTMNTASMVARRRVYHQHGMNDIGMIVGMEDYESMIRMVAAGFGGVVIPDVLFDYRVRSDSMMRGFNRLNDVYSYERIAARNGALFREHAAGIVGLLNANGPGFKHDNPLIEVLL